MEEKENRRGKRNEFEKEEVVRLEIKDERRKWKEEGGQCEKEEDCLTRDYSVGERKQRKEENWRLRKTGLASGGIKEREKEEGEGKGKKMEKGE